MRRSGIRCPKSVHMHMLCSGFQEQYHQFSGCETMVVLLAMIKVALCSFGAMTCDNRAQRVGSRNTVPPFATTAARATATNRQCASVATMY